MPVPDQLAGFKFNVRPPYGEEKLWVFATDKQVTEFEGSMLLNGLKQVNQSIHNIRISIKRNPIVSYGESSLTILVTEK